MRYCLLRYFILLLLVLAPVVHLSAQDEVIQDSGAVENTTASTTFGAYVDAYYAYSLDQPKDKNIPYEYNYSRHNEFNINLAVLSAKYTSDRIRGALSLQAGTYPQFNYASEPALYQHVYEAYAGFRPNGKTWLDAGIFSSHIGFESALANNNWTLSRSMSAENTPYYETGLRFTYERNKQWTLYAFLLNGWQNIREVNEGKAIGTQVQYKPSDNTLLNWSTYIGSDLPDSTSRMRIFNDFYITHRLSEKWKLAALLDIGFQKNTANTAWASWYSGAVVLRYEYTDHAAFAGRIEYYHDPSRIMVQTITAHGYQVAGASINFDYKPARNFMFRLEAKQLLAKDKVYETKTTPSAANTIFTSSMIISF